MKPNLKSTLRHFASAIVAAFLLMTTGTASRAFAQGEVLQKGEGIASFVFVRSATEKRFDFLGQRARVIPPAGPEFRGAAETNVYSFDVAYGLTNRLEVHLTIPFAQTRQASRDASGKLLSDPTQSPREAGLSNVRFGVRYNFVSEPFFLTAKFDVKTPAGGTPDLEKLFNGTTLPVDEGQTDYDLTAQASKGFTLFNRGARIGGEAGIRFRRPQKEGALDPFTKEKLPLNYANEFLYGFRFSYGLTPRVSVSLSGDGLTQGSYNVPFRFTRVGNDGQLKTVGTQGAVPPGFKPDFEKQSGRKIFSLGPLVNVFVTPRTAITGGVLFAVAGRNYPAGQYWIFGVSRSF